MKTIANQKFLWPILFAVAVFSVFLIHDITAQNGEPGPLNPPGAPAPTMNTLEDIFNAIEGSPGKNFGALFQSTAFAFDDSTGAWVQSGVFGGGATLMIESNGNIAAYGPQGASAWSSAQGWNAQSLVGIDQLIGSNGNFCIRDQAANRVYAWDKEDGLWDELTTVAGPTSIVGSNGNFAVIGINSAAAWTPDGGWVGGGSGPPVSITGAD